MRVKPIWSLAAAAIVIAALTATSCAGPTADPTPTPEPTATATSTPRPTRTPTAIPPTPTPSPTPSDAQALLMSLQEQQQNITHYRSEMDIVMQATADGFSQSFDIKVEIEAAEPDSRMRMVLNGGFFNMDLEQITKDGVSYMRMGDEWTSFEGDAQGSAQMDMFNPEDMEDFLEGASNPRVVGRRDVKGVECDIIAFDLSYEDMARLAAMGGNPIDQQDAADAESVQFDNMKVEMAIGVEDKLMHQFVLEMAGHEKDSPKERFAMAMTMNIWDIGAEDIVIEAPANAVPSSSSLPFSVGTPSPTR